MKRMYYGRALALCGLSLHLHLSAAILVGPGGASETFNTYVFSSEWSTRLHVGASATITTASALEALIQSSGVSGFTGLLMSNTLPPTVALLNVWNGAAQNIQSRPTGSSALALLATLQNDTGADASFLNISYNFGSAYHENVNESIPGLRAYYSLTGLPGSFQFIPEFSTATPGLLSATLNLGTWANGSPLYLMWADDNGPGSAGGEPGATLEGAYTIDNFLVVVPEPSLMALAVVGALAGLAGWHRRRLAHP